MMNTPDNIAITDWTLSCASAAAARTPTGPSGEAGSELTTSSIFALPMGGAAMRYPEELEVMVGGATLTPEDYPKLVTEYGKYLVMMGRFAGDDSARGFVAATSVVKLGVLSLFTKAVEAESIIPYLDDDVLVFEGRSSILVCSPPLSGEQAMVLAEVAMNEDAIIGSKLPTLAALNAALAFTPSRVKPIIDDIIRCLNAAKAEFDMLDVEAVAPIGDWKIYTDGEIPPVTKLTDSIKEFASRSRVYTPLPSLDKAEAEALAQIHDLLITNSMPGHAQLLMSAALATPMFAHLCHDRALFAAERSPRLEAQWPSFGPAMLKYLLSEELTCGARRNTHPKKVTPVESWIFTLDELLALGVRNAPLSEAHAFERLDTYVGGYLRDLDLSRTLITGSAIAAALIVTDVEKYRYQPRSYYEKDWNGPEWAQWCSTQYGRRFEDYIAAHYPPVKTVPRDREEYLKLLPSNPKRSEQDELVMTTESNGQGGFTLTLEMHADRDVKSTVLDVKPGADLDMSIDVETDEEFDAIARGHYRAVVAKHPTAVLTKVPRKGLDYNWAVTTPCPGAISTFRPVEMYRANFNHIVTHHVGMVSGAYTAIFGGPPKFVVSARLACAMDQLATPNYYYFASRKIEPHLIVLKYKARGFGLDAFPAGIKEAMSVVMGQDKYWSGCVTDSYSNGHFDYPAINATGNFSAYALEAELRAEKL